jgi:energy-coupling factor transport system permease protein
LIPGRIKPEARIILYVLFVIFLFVVADLTVYLLIMAVLALLLVRIPFRTVKAGWIPISIFLSYTFISNVVGRPGKIVFSWGPVTLTGEGIDIAAVRTLRVLFMIAGAKIMMASAKSEETIEALGRLLGPLEKIGLPVKDFFETMGLTVKCFPVLKDMALETYRENMKTADAKGFWGRARVIAAFLLPMFVKSLQSPETFFEKGEVRSK